METALDTNRLQELAAEINVLQRQTALGIVEIGRRLSEARKMHGSDEGGFKAWVESSCDVSRSTAYNFIRASDEFGDRVQTFGHINPSKLYKLLELPADTREEFVSQPQQVPSTGETKPVADMTTRELSEAVKARKEAEKEAANLRRHNQELHIALEDELKRTAEIREVEVVPAEMAAELADLRGRKHFTTEYQQRKTQLEQDVADLLEAKRKMAEAQDETERRKARSSEFVAIFRRAAKPLKEAKGGLEQLAESGQVHWAWVRELESDLKVLYGVLDMVDEMLKTVDVTNITEGVTTNG